MAMRTSRIASRLSVDERLLIERAAALEGRSVSSFVVAAAVARADAVITVHERTTVPAPYFDRLLAALETPDDAPTLLRSVQWSARHPRIPSAPRRRRAFPVVVRRQRGG